MGQVEERKVPVEELKEAAEVFCTGTATGVASVGSITFNNTRFVSSSSLTCINRCTCLQSKNDITFMNLSVYKSAGLSTS